MGVGVTYPPPPPPHPPDNLQNHIGKLKLLETTLSQFNYFSLVAEKVLVIPPSNTSQERLFRILPKK